MGNSVWVLVGTRPEVIKQVSLYWALKKEFQSVKLVGTGQHRELLDQALLPFDVRLDFNLDLENYGQGLGEVASEILQKITQKLKIELPLFVVVQGDTSSAMIVALASFYLKIPVVHNEAGLRTFDMHNPFPEELNRKLIASLASFHMAPTSVAAKNLLKENVKKEVHVVGNTGIDTLFWILKNKKPNSDVYFAVQEKIKKGLKPVLITSHRRENKEQFDIWFQTLSAFAKKHPNLFLILPQHPNNLSKEAIDKHLKNLPNVLMTTPFDYTTTCHLLRECLFVVTDSGGIQEECATLGVPVVVCRKTTERVEALSKKLAKLSSPDTPKKLMQDFNWALKKGQEKGLKRGRSSKNTIQNIFGDGKSSTRIAKILRKKIK